MFSDRLHNSRSGWEPSNLSSSFFKEKVFFSGGLENIVNHCGIKEQEGLKSFMMEYLGSSEAIRGK